MNQLVALFGVFLGTLLTCRAELFDVRAHGAKGDGETLDTAAINAAIDAAAAAGGGTVDFPAGSYLSYSVRLRSRVRLHLDAGATLIAADPPADLAGGYDAPEPNPGTDQYQDFGHSHWHNSLIWGENLEDVAITGPGRIFGRGLSRGAGIKDPLPSEQAWPRRYEGPRPQVREPIVPGPFHYPNARDTLPAGVGNKAIALKDCRNVILRDFSVFHGGHFAILATGVDNLTIDNLVIDTNRDGIDIDCCVNVRVVNCSINSPTDDALVLKSSYGLGRVRVTENVTISDCFVSGYDEGSLLDGTRTRGPHQPGGPYGRIKFGTEANGGFRNITIANCVFDYCRGLALEQVDGGVLEDIAISNLTMRDIVNTPIFIRLGARLRGPDQPPVGSARRITISHVIASNVSAEQGIFIAGIPGHRIEDVSLDSIRILYRGGGTAEQADRTVPEQEDGYPEPVFFGTLPAWGLYARHVTKLSIRDVDWGTVEDDLRPAVVLEDVADARFDSARLSRAEGAPAFALMNVTGLALHNCPGLPETNRPEPIAAERW